jgi:PPOX class probable F420-dependent enzyme
VPEIPESHRDLLEAPVAILSTVGRTGIPHTTAVWFLYDTDGEVKLWLSDARQKMKNLLERPELSLFILDTANPARYLAFRGRGEFAPDPDCVIGDKFGEKYDSDIRKMLREGETRYTVTVRPIQVMVR